MASSAIMATMLVLLAVMEALISLKRQSRLDSCLGEKAFIASYYLVGEVVLMS